MLITQRKIWSATQLGSVARLDGYPGFFILKWFIKKRVVINSGLLFNVTLSKIRLLFMTYYTLCLCHYCNCGFESA